MDNLFNNALATNEMINSQTFKYQIIIALLSIYTQKDDLRQFGQHYQKHQDYKSLQKVVELLPEHIDTTKVKEILGEPNSLGFEYRYTVDSTGIQGCVVGAVLQIDIKGQIRNKWTGEICE